MKEHKRLGFPSILAISIFAAAAFLLILLGIAGSLNHTSVLKIRPGGNVVRVNDYTVHEVNQEDAPTGKVEEYRFTIGKPPAHGTCLTFYLEQQYAQVYLDGTCIYSLEPSGDLPMVKTTGNHWVDIPLYPEDTGKEVSIAITPVYESARGREVAFLMGPEHLVLKGCLQEDLPVLIVSVLVVFTGLILSCIAVYLQISYKEGKRLLALGCFSILLGVCRFANTRFMMLLLPEKTAFLFFLSAAAMMSGMIPLMMYQRQKVNERFINGYTFFLALLCISAALSQLLGWAEIRAFVPVIYGTIIAGLLIVFGIRFYRMRKSHSEWGADSDMIALAVLAVGALLDGYNYYTQHTSSRLVYMMAAFLFYIIFYIITGVISFMDIYTRQQLLLADQKTQLIQSRTAAMMGQIRSHFVFNILNAISGMCKYDPQRADQTVVCFARYLRTNIDIMQDDHPVSFRTALKHLEDYIALEQIRFGDKIQFIKEIEAEDFLMPSMILQPIVENAIKHGLMPKASGGTITLRTCRESGEIRISIHDDGVGFDTESAGRQQSVALKNVQLRLQYIANGKLDVESTPGEGTTVTVSMPFQAAAAVAIRSDGED